MELPFKFFYDLEELAQCKWCGFSSVDEILHAAAAGHFPLNMLLNEGRYCFYSTLNHFFTDLFTGDAAIDAGIRKYSDYKSVAIDCFQYDYEYPMARVASGAIFDFLCRRNNEYYVDCLSSYFHSSGEIKDVGQKIVRVDMELSPLPIPIHLKKENLFIDRVAAFEYEEKKNSIKQSSGQSDTSRSKKPASEREEKTNLKLIAVLKTIIIEKTDLKSQAAIIDHIKKDHRFKHIFGIKERCIEGRFSQANTEFKDAGD